MFLKKSKKYQGSLEYLIIIAAVLAIAAIVVLFLSGAFTGASSTGDISKCKNAAAQCATELATSEGAVCSYCAVECADVFVAACEAGKPNMIYEGALEYVASGYVDIVVTGGDSTVGMASEPVLISPHERQLVQLNIFVNSVELVGPQGVERIMQNKNLEIRRGEYISMGVARVKEGYYDRARFYFNPNTLTAVDDAGNVLTGTLVMEGSFIEVPVGKWIRKEQGMSLGLNLRMMENFEWGEGNKFYFNIKNPEAKSFVEPVSPEMKHRAEQSGALPKKLAASEVNALRQRIGQWNQRGSDFSFVISADPGQYAELRLEVIRAEVRDSNNNWHALMIGPSRWVSFESGGSPVRLFARPLPYNFEGNVEELRLMFGPNFETKDINGNVMRGVVDQGIEGLISMQIGISPSIDKNIGITHWADFGNIGMKINEAGGTGLFLLEAGNFDSVTALIDKRHMSAETYFDLFENYGGPGRHMGFEEASGLMEAIGESQTIKADQMGEKHPMEIDFFQPLEIIVGPIMSR